VDCTEPFNRLLERIAGAEAGCTLLVVQGSSASFFKDMAVTHAWICTQGKLKPVVEIQMQQHRVLVEVMQALCMKSIP